MWVRGRADHTWQTYLNVVSEQRERKKSNRLQHPSALKKANPICHFFSSACLSFPEVLCHSQILFVITRIVPKTFELYLTSVCFSVVVGSESFLHSSVQSFSLSSIARAVQLDVRKSFRHTRFRVIPAVGSLLVVGKMAEHG